MSRTRAKEANPRDLSVAGCLLDELHAGAQAELGLSGRGRGPTHVPTPGVDGGAHVTAHLRK
jgi:hypothetical protein